MEIQIHAICSLLKNDDYDFIQSLLETSFVSEDVLFEAIKQCYNREPLRQFNIPAIVKLIDNNFDDQDVLDCLFTLFVKSSQPNGAEENVDLFKRMIDLGAKIKKMDDSYVTSMPPDMFFYYAERNDTDIDLYMRSAIFNRLRGHVRVYDWIVERWTTTDIKYDLLWFYDIARVTYETQQYFAQVMTKLSENIDLHVILFYLLLLSYDNSQDLLIYVPDCKYGEELLLFGSIIALSYSYRILDDDTMRLKLYMEENSDAKEIGDDIFLISQNDKKNRWEHTIPKLTQLADMMKIDN